MASSLTNKRRTNTGLRPSTRRPAPRFRAYHGYAVNSTALHLLAETEEIFKIHSSGKSRVSSDHYFTAAPTPVPHITSAVLTRSAARTLARPAAGKHSSKQNKKVMVSMTNAEGEDDVVANFTSDVMVDAQSQDIATVVTCKQCNQSCPICILSIAT
jgi:hypothetical protein